MINDRQAAQDRLENEVETARQAQMDTYRNLPEADAQWRQEHAAYLANQPWWEAWVIFRETLQGYNPQAAFAAGWHAREAREEGLDYE